MNYDLKPIKTLEAKHMFLNLLDHNIIEMVVKENVEIDVSSFQSIQDMKKELVRDEKYYLLFITPELGTLTKEAREYLAGPEANMNAIAKAIVVSNLGMRLISNFFVKFNNPQTPHKVFDNRKDAIEWLLSVKP